MKSWVQIKIKRMLAIFLASLAYLFLEFLNTQSFFSQNLFDISSSSWLYFGFFSLTAFIFLAVGSLVWLYACDRHIALLLFSASLALMAAFSVETGQANNLALSAINVFSGIVAVPLSSALFLLFPRNYLLEAKAGTRSLAQKRPSITITRLLRIYLLTLIGSAILLIIFSIIFLLRFPDWFSFIIFLYYAAGTLGILAIIVSTYFLSFSTRERQQLRILVGGVILSFAPTTLFCLLSQFLNIGTHFVINGQNTLMAFCSFPLAIGYAILRYQLLVLDSYVRRIVSFFSGFICLSAMEYVLFAVYNVFFDKIEFLHVKLYIIFFIAITAMLSPCVWWLARLFAERIFFSEVLHYRRLVDEPASIGDKVIDLDAAVSLITSAAVHTFDTVQVCVFALDESSGQYRLYPAWTNDPDDMPRRNILQSLQRTLNVSAAGELTDSLSVRLPAMQRLAASRRPLLLSEVIRGQGEEPFGLDRYIISLSPLGEEDWLLAPIRAQGKMIGVLVLGERGDHQPYAGPDFEIVNMLLARFSPVLETARLYVHANQHATLLNNLYSVSTMSSYTFNRVEDVIDAYTAVAASAASAGAEMWLYDSQEGTLRLSSFAGFGPHLTTVKQLRLVKTQDWVPMFFEGNQTCEEGQTQPPVPACLPGVPIFPFAWLPLQKDERHLGVLVLTYPRAHFFQKEEMRVLEMFVNQYVAALENVRITAELLAAYERQKELDKLKDQFIMMASHELRTPLTAVMGYIELLSQYQSVLSAEAQRNFIEKAQLGCDELNLLVGNIMDASRVDIEAEKVNLQPVSLLICLRHTLEIVAATTIREQREIVVDVAPDLYVFADDVRLRQVLLNLVTNALKYSPEGTKLEIGAEIWGQQVQLHIRDYGLGVPPEEQQRLFERFVRLDRDINSPVRGAGLGLFICKQLLESMGGDVWVESSGEAGAGSVFSFALQLAPKNQHAFSGVLQLPV